MADILFSITNLSCAYNRSEENVVLRIKKLDIAKGKLIFLLGPSGCGKSTLLETLGLMNNTIASGNIYLYPESNASHIDITTLWQSKYLKVLTEIRKKHYCFIFQNTNLMDNFTAYENVCLAGMIKKDVRLDKVLSNARDLMNLVKLTDSDVNLDTKTVNLSGGQRQRLAFVRALSNKTTVLFGDEPTGNLDEANANELFDIITGQVSQGLSAIIVSHDINLALKFADEIVVITYGKRFGEIEEKNIFRREVWHDKNEVQYEMFKRQLQSYYYAVESNKIINKDLSSRVNTNITYRSLFLQKESKVLLGKNYLNFLLLALILFFTFLAIGFANGSLDYLSKKMNSAFVNWIAISIPFSREQKLDEIELQLSSPEVKKKYFFEIVTPYIKSPFFVWNKDINDFLPTAARSVDVESDSKLINEFVLNKSNIVAGSERGFKDKMDIAVIVTRQFLFDFNYSENSKFIYCSYTVRDAASNDMKDIKVPIPIRTIVNELPGKYGLIYPIEFFRSYMLESDPVFDIRKTNEIELFTETTERDQVSHWKKSVLDLLKQTYKDESTTPDIYLREDTLGFMPGNTLQIIFPAFNYHQGNSIDTLSQSLIQYSSKVLKLEGVTRYYNFNNRSETSKDVTYDELSIYFQRLDRIRDFANFLHNSYNEKADGNKIVNQEIIQVDITKVIEKENFNFLSNVTRTISFLLVLFGTLAVCLFIFNLLKSHLEKVKMNLGTLKAIGLSDRESTNIYLIITLLFIVTAIIAALLIAAGLGNLLNSFFKRNMQVEQEVDYFKIVNYNTMVALVVILSSSLIVSYLTIKKILHKTPGDLIYNR